MHHDSVVGLLTTALQVWLLQAVTVSAAPAQVPLHFFEPTGQQANGNQLGAVASENRACSQIGIDLLNAGGNAADALLGTVFCVGVVDCHHSGIGGGGFALARSTNGSYEAIDFRESAPAAAHEDMFKDNVLRSLFGGLARYDGM